MERVDLEKKWQNATMKSNTIFTWILSDNKEC